MGYIRSNEDWDRAMGISPQESRVQAALERRGVDYGVCNPIKAKHAAELEAEIREQMKDKHRG